MALRDEVITLLREKLNPGFETATLAALIKAFTLRTLVPELKARRVAALNLDSYEQARADKEAALAAEEQARKATVAAAEASVDAELGMV